MYRNCVLRYFRFIARMIPWSSGCRIEVVLAGKYFNFTLQCWTSECDVALPETTKPFDLYDQYTYQISLTKFLKYLKSIQVFLLAWYSTGNVFLFTCLNQQGFNDFQITNGVSLSPTIFVQRDIVSRIFDFLPPLNSWPFWCKILSAVVRKKRPVSSMLNISHGLEVFLSNPQQRLCQHQLTTFYIKSYIIALAEALKPAVWCFNYVLPKSLAD